MSHSSFESSVRRLLRGPHGTHPYISLGALDDLGHLQLERLPNVLKVLLENVLRACVLDRADRGDVLALAAWRPEQRRRGVVPFYPARVLLQDFTGIPALVDLAALRDAAVLAGVDPADVNPCIPVDLVIDHSVMADYSGSPDALRRNMDREFERNAERYRFLRWAERAFNNLRIVPPGGGICHQVNLELLAEVVHCSQEADDESLIYPDSLVGTDSHTTMVNSLSVLGWGVGGIEAEAAMLGRGIEVPIPDVVGVRLSGQPAEGVTATDLVLTVTEILRRQGVVGTFVEFFGEGLGALSLADRATLANMAPEYGATCAHFPVDSETLRYLRLSGRKEPHIALVEAYARAQGWWHEVGNKEPEYTRVANVDLASVRPSLAGPKRPQDRVALGDLADSFRKAFQPSTGPARRVPVSGSSFSISEGSVVLAAITSCTNTSNPAAMVAAGLLARKALKRGVRTQPWVTTSLAPGSPVVSDYLTRLGLQEDLDELGFNVVAYGCAACVGNTAPLSPGLVAAITENHLPVAAVLSGNRNFEGRINPHIRASYLASPALVVVYALAGSVLADLTCEPVALDEDCEPVYLRDIWPSNAEIESAIQSVITPEMFRGRYAGVFEGTAAWKKLPAPTGLTYDWDKASSYIRRPPFLDSALMHSAVGEAISEARILLLLGDGVTTDHISPAGPIAAQGAAADYLRGLGVDEHHLNAYGARRGNHEVMIRGAFANPRLDNEMVPGRGGITRLMPEGTRMTVLEAAERYHQTATPLVVVAGRDYGGGSSRDWAAKATALLGVRAVIAESFERIHRANLIALGVLPLQFVGGATRHTLGLDGSERLTIRADGSGLEPGGGVLLTIRQAKQPAMHCTLLCRIDTAGELEMFRSGGLLPLMFREINTKSRHSSALASARS